MQNCKHAPHRSFPSALATLLLALNVAPYRTNKIGAAASTIPMLATSVDACGYPMATY